MIYPAFFHDEDNYETYQQSLREIQDAEENVRTFIGSGCDAREAWELSSQAVCDLVAPEATLPARSVQ